MSFLVQPRPRCFRSIRFFETYSSFLGIYKQSNTRHVSVTSYNVILFQTADIGYKLPINMVSVGTVMTCKQHR